MWLKSLELEDANIKKGKHKKVFSEVYRQIVGNIQPRKLKKKRRRRKGIRKRE